VQQTGSKIKALRLEQLPEDMRIALKVARAKRHWSQRELAKQVGLTQAHVSGIESGKIVPRYDTILELIRVLGHDLIMVPRAVVPAVLALIRDYSHLGPGDGEARPLYANMREDETLDSPDEV
jgi:transcriptional regulator with XRE-family HTH domain